MTNKTHVHKLAWSFEGPLWFCECGTEFYPKSPPLTVPVTVPTKRKITFRLVPNTR